MANLFGHLNLNDSEYVYSLNSGQNLLWTAAQEYLERVNRDLNSAMAVFVESETEAFKERFKMAGGGYLQRRRSDGRFGAVKASGSWDVAYPLEDFGAQIAYNDVDMAYMTVREFTNHIETVVNQNTNTVRFEMLKALFNGTNATFLDERHGNLTVVRLANGDGVLYPPVLGASAEAQDDHYIETGYLASAISDSNNPYKTIVEELSEHYGEQTGGESIVVFIHPDEADETMDLTDFVEVEDRFIRSGDDKDLPEGLPTVPGKIIGRMTGNSACWVVQWRWIPSGYMLAVHLDAPPPLKKRVDPVATGLGTGLQLVAQDEQFPFMSSFWRHRFGFGVGNRLNGVAIDFGTSGDYVIPTIYQ